MYTPEKGHRHNCYNNLSCHYFLHANQYNQITKEKHNHAQSICCLIQTTRNITARYPLQLCAEIMKTKFSMWTSSVSFMDSVYCHLYTRVNFCSAESIARATRNRWHLTSRYKSIKCTIVDCSKTTAWSTSTSNRPTALSYSKDTVYISTASNKLSPAFLLEAHVVQ